MLLTARHRHWHAGRTAAGGEAGPGQGALLLLRRAPRLAPEAHPKRLAVLYTQARAIVQAVDGCRWRWTRPGVSGGEWLESARLPDALSASWRHRLSLAGTTPRLSGDGGEYLALSFAQVEQANPAAADLLRLCQFAAGCGSRGNHYQRGSELGPTLGPVAGDLVALNEALRGLRAIAGAARR